MAHRTLGALGARHAGWTPGTTAAWSEAPGVVAGLMMAGAPEVAEFA